jgi:hypothetical protein
MKKKQKLPERLARKLQEMREEHELEQLFPLADHGVSQVIRPKTKGGRLIAARSAKEGVEERTAQAIDKRTILRKRPKD